MSPAVRCSAARCAANDYVGTKQMIKNSKAGIDEVGEQYHDCQQLVLSI